MSASLVGRNLRTCIQIKKSSELMALKLVYLMINLENPPHFRAYLGTGQEMSMRKTIIL